MSNSDTNALISEIIEHINKLPHDQRPVVVNGIREGVINHVKLDLKRASEYCQLISESINKLQNESVQTAENNTITNFAKPAEKQYLESPTFTDEIKEEYRAKTTGEG